MSKLVDKYFSSADLEAIKTAVTAAERKTDGEIAIQISNRCKNWLLDKLLYASLVAILCSMVALLLTKESDWGSYYNFTQATLWGIIGFVITYFLAGRILKTKSSREVVWKTALGRFAQLKPTRGKTGVLIFVSLEEAQAAIVADKMIAEKLPANYWDQPHSLLVNAMKKFHHAEGIVAAVEEIGEKLAEHFPRSSDDFNELPDAPEIVSN